MKEKIILTDEGRKVLYDEALAYFNIDASEVNKLTLKNLDYGYRCRYEKDADGDTLKIIDRGFLRVCMKKTGFGDSMDVVNCFFYGKRTIGFIIVDDVLYINKNLKASADFLMLLYGFIKYKDADVIIDDVQWTDKLHTGESPKKEARDLDLKTIKSVDELDADLGF